ncbi:hypothetical protein BX600DRAFT_443827 [Xylariales sp. PMI_506]|nr:hypothetical protein BX600DRAFT_443827 [Xylariales sp. PMI_506]
MPSSIALDQQELERVAVSSHWNVGSCKDEHEHEMKIEVDSSQAEENDETTENHCAMDWQADDACCESRCIEEDQSATGSDSPESEDSHSDSDNSSDVGNLEESCTAADDAPLILFALLGEDVVVALESFHRTIATQKDVWSDTRWSAASSTSAPSPWECDRLVAGSFAVLSRYHDLVAVAYWPVGNPAAVCVLPGTNPLQSMWKLGILQPLELLSAHLPATHDHMFQLLHYAYTLFPSIELQTPAVSRLLKPLRQRHLSRFLAALDADLPCHLLRVLSSGGGRAARGHCGCSGECSVTLPGVTATDGASVLVVNSPEHDGATALLSRACTVVEEGRGDTTSEAATNTIIPIPARAKRRECEDSETEEVRKRRQLEAGQYAPGQDCDGSP